MTESEDDHCDHHDAQVAVRCIGFEDGAPVECTWCEAPAAIGLVKSERHEIAFCDECCELVSILAGREVGE